MSATDTNERSRVRQASERASYERNAAYAILDEALVCHAGFCVDGQPFVIPLLHARDGDRLLLHGAIASRFQRCAALEMEMSVTVTLLDGLVLARSTFKHSANYRCVMVFGRARAVTDPGEKAAALERLVEHIVPGRTADTRESNRKELNATGVVALPIEDFSIKSRTGMPEDNVADLKSPIWAGVLPMDLTTGTPQADTHTLSSVEAPEYVKYYRRRSA